MKINNYNNLSPARQALKRLPRPLSQGGKLDEPVSVARVRPRTSKGITDLLLPRTSIGYTPIVPLRSHVRIPKEFAELFSRSRSRSLTELTRQITPPTKNGHAPPPIESRKIFNLSILTMSGPGKFSRVVKLSRRLHSWWCPSVNSFKFQPCDHTPPGTQRL